MTRLQYVVQLENLSHETNAPIKPTEWLKTVPDADKQIASSAFVNWQGFKSYKLQAL